MISDYYGRISNFNDYSLDDSNDARDLNKVHNDPVSKLQLFRSPLYQARTSTQRKEYMYIYPELVAYGAFVSLHPLIQFHERSKKEIGRMNIIFSKSSEHDRIQSALSSDKTPERLS